MGVDLCTYGNHKIDTTRDYTIVAEEIKTKLNSFRLINENQIMVIMNFWDSSYLAPPAEMLVNIRNGIFKPLEKEHWDWTYNIETTDDGYKHIDFQGFIDFELEFTKNKIYFWEPPYRYLGWFRMDKIVRNEWRKYMYQIITLFGGNRAIYLPDSILAAEKYLDDHDSIDSPFEEIEHNLVTEFGKNSFTFETVKEEDNIDYYIDTFIDLKLENEISVADLQYYLWNEEEKELKSRLKH